jgi:hypothetical protein
VRPRGSPSSAFLHPHPGFARTLRVTSPAYLLYRLRWLHLPGILLIALLQRTPVLRLLTAQAAPLAASPVGQVLKSAFALGALGAMHSRAGATTFIVTQGTTPIINISTTTNANVRNPATGAVGTALTPVAFTYTGTPSAPQYYRVTGQLPPGLSFVPAAVNGTIPTGTPGISGTPTQGGSFTIQVQGFGLAGNGQPEPIVFTISGGAASVPAFTLQPTGQSVVAGATVTLSVTATGSPTPTFQWRRNGTPLAGATASTLTLTNVQAADAGDYTVVATNSAGSVTSSAATVAVTTVDPNARLSNLSVRTAMAAGQTLIVGVVVEGSRDVLVRAAGPALAGFGISAPMSDPRLELYSGSTLELSNNDWTSSLADLFGAVGAFPFTAGSRDAAFLRTLVGAYSIQARGTGPGVVLVEAYDTGALTPARLVNVSARNRVGTGDDILIAGFNVAGAGPKQLLIRAVGPKLGAFNVDGFLVDPKLEIYNGAGVKVTENDNWAAALAPTFTAVGAFGLDANSRDAALLTVLAPGSYTAQVSGVGGGTGEALIEIYEVK